jgi:lysophospholipase L1-like esterase
MTGLEYAASGATGPAGGDLEGAFPAPTLTSGNIRRLDLAVGSPSKQAEAEQTLLASLTATFANEATTGTLSSPVTINAVEGGTLNAKAPWAYQAADVALSGTNVAVLAPYSKKTGKRSFSASYPYQVCFDFDREQFIAIVNVESQTKPWRLRVWANGLCSAYQVYPENNNTKYLLISFGSPAKRRVILEMDTKAYFAGLVRNAADTISYPSEVAPATVAIVGDSFAVGGGATVSGFSSQAFPFDLVRWLGVVNWRQYGVGGTGLLNEGTEEQGNYRQRISDVIGYAPELALIQGSINDRAFTAAEIEAQCAAYIAELRAALPKTMLIVCAPMPVNNTERAANATAAAALKKATETAGVTYVDGYGQEWFYGTGHVGAPKGDGNADFYASELKIEHPSLAGHDYIARRLAAGIATAVKAAAGGATTPAGPVGGALEGALPNPQLSAAISKRIPAERGRSAEMVAGKITIAAPAVTAAGVIQVALEGSLVTTGPVVTERTPGTGFKVEALATATNRVNWAVYPE